MDKVEKYRKIIGEEFEIWTSANNSHMPEVQHKTLIDESKNEFILYVVGWHNKVFRHYWVAHIEIVGEKVLIYEDATGVNLKEQLSQKGILNEDIIFAFNENAETVKAIRGIAA